jgi:hypothetical protein
MIVTRAQIRQLIIESVINEADIPEGADVLVKWDGKWYGASLDGVDGDEYRVEWDSGEGFDNVPKGDVKIKPEVDTLGDINREIIDIVWRVIAGEGKSKDYKAHGSTNSKGLFIDSEGDTAVGVLHFTTSGLPKLYNEMGNVVEKYFPGKTVNDLKSFSKKANGSEIQLGKKDPEKHGWWTEGMIKFLDSEDSKPVQDKAAIKKFKSGFNNWKGSKWVKSPRDLAIFISLANSKWSYIRDAGKETGWKPDKMLDWYKEKTGGRTRIGLVNKLFPK